MIVRRRLAGLLVLGLTVPALAAAPRDRASAAGSQPSPRPGMGVRVFSRADGTGALAQATSPAPSPPSSASPSASGSPTASSSASPAAMRPPGPVPTLSPELTAKARAEFLAWQSGKIDPTHYTPELKARLTPQFVADVATKYVKPIGTLTAFTQIQKTTYQGADIYVYRAAGDKTTVSMVLSWNDAHLIQFVRFVPPQS